tara:strand:- start:196 stop:429 length:234 start_codon:yes stop_codon:yes gene_type:complete
LQVKVIHKIGQHEQPNIGEKGHNTKRVEDTSHARKNFFHIITMLAPKLFLNYMDNIVFRTRIKKNKPSQREKEKLGQ